MAADALWSAADLYQERPDFARILDLLAFAAQGAAGGEHAGEAVDLALGGRVLWRTDAVGQNGDHLVVRFVRGQRLPDDRRQALEVDGLLEEIEGAQAQRSDARLFAAVAGQDDEW